MEYSLKKINIDAEKGEKVEFPPLADRVIEMRGQVVEITLSGLAITQANRLKKIKEFTAKREFEQAKIVNIESFHPFVKELSEQDLLTAWMYFESKAMIKGCDDEIAKNQGYVDIDNAEIEEIKKQIPELSEAALEVDKMINPPKENV